MDNSQVGTALQLLLLLVVSLAVVLGVFLLFREFWCWYWKINERIALMRETNALLAGMRGDVAPGTSHVASRGAVQCAERPSDGPLVGVPQSLQGAYRLWQADPTERNYMAFLNAMSAASRQLPVDVTARQLQATFPDIASRVDFGAILEAR